MKYRRLGRTNLKVSVIGMGTWQFGGEWAKVFHQLEVDAMFDAAREAGINFIDTAECYGDHTSEAFIGNAIKRDRAGWIVATKFGHKFHKNFERTEPRTPADLIEQLEASLKALQTDYVDLLQYHSFGDKDFDRDDLNDQLRKMVQSGKVRHVGNSIGSNDNLYQVEQSPHHHMEVIQLIYNRLDQTPEKRVLDACIKQDLGVLARVPLASGLLSGKYKPGATFPADDVRTKWRHKDFDARLKDVEDIARSEVPQGVPMAEWALAWCLQHPAVSAVIPGCKDVGQVQSNARAANLIGVRDDHPQAWRGS